MSNATLKFNIDDIEDEIFNTIRGYYHTIRRCAKENAENERIAAELGVSEKTLNRWLRRQAMPRATQARMFRELASRYEDHGSGDAA